MHPYKKMITQQLQQHLICWCSSAPIFTFLVICWYFGWKDDRITNANIKSMLLMWCVVLASYDDQKAPSYLLHLFFLYVHFLHLRYLVLYGCAMCINQKITTRVHNMYLLHFLVLYLYLLFLWLCSAATFWIAAFSKLESSLDVQTKIQFRRPN